MKAISVISLLAVASTAKAFAVDGRIGLKAVPRPTLARGSVISMSTAKADFNLWDKKPPAYKSTPTYNPRYKNSDWFINFLNFPKSIILRRISSHLLANTLWAWIVFAMYRNIPEVAAAVKGMTTVPHSMAVGTLGLLLVFRTNSAYDRFWEGRKLWGKLVNMTRENARLGHTFLRGKNREAYLALVAAFPSLLLQHLQGTVNTNRPSGGLFSEKQREALNGLLTDEQLELLWQAKNRPFMVTKLIGAIVSDSFTSPTELESRFGKIDMNSADSGAKLKVAAIGSSLTAERAHMELMISDYANVYGACERIVKSAVPPSYSRHTSRMLSMWCFTLPFALVSSLGWRMVPAVATICWMMFAIEEVGHSVEDPFNLHVLDPMWKGREDEMRIEVSLNVLKNDVLEPLPPQ